MFQNHTLPPTFEDFMLRYKELSEQHPALFVKNEPRYTQVKEQIRTLVEYVNAVPQDTTVTVEHDCLVGTALWVEIVTDEFFVHDLKKLCEITSLANNLDVCATTDGKVSVNFSFENCFTKHYLKTTEGQNHD